MSRRSDMNPAGTEVLTLAQLIAQDPFRARKPSTPGARTPLGTRPGMRGLKTGDLDGLSPYLPGGDIRMIDWRGFARSGQLRLKEREREAHSAIMLVADFGPHMRFGTAGGTLAMRAALSLARQAWTAYRRDEPVGIATTASGVITQPARGRRRLMHALDGLAKAFTVPVDKTLSLENILAEAGASLRSADELWLFSDFHHWVRADAVPKAATGRSGRWHAVQINDPVHLSPPAAGHYPARSMTKTDRDEDLHIGHDPTRHAALVETVSSVLNRQMETLGWRITGTRGPAQPSVSNVA